MKLNQWFLGVLCVFSMATSLQGADVTSDQDSYRIGPNDIIKILVFGEEDLSTESKVEGDGKINYPLLGTLQVGGWTIEALQRELTGRLADGYVRSPKVAVSIIRHRNFYVGGEVKSPGGFAYEQGLTVQKAIALAGGFTDKADRTIFRIVRPSGSRVETFEVPLHALMMPDDILVIQHDNHQVYVSGEVKVPGGYSYHEGLTVMRALALAGGATERATKYSIKVTRVIGGVAETSVASPESPVLPDDIVVVEPEHHKFYASGEVRTPGGYPYQEDLTVHRAIAMAGGLTDKAERGALHILRRVGSQEETVPARLDTLVLPEDIILIAEGQKFFVSGEVKTPGRYLYEKGLTIHKALSLAGGRTEKAEKLAIKLTRVIDGIAHTTEADLDAPVYPEDFIVIPELKKVYVDGEVKRAGDYPYERGLTVHKAITMAGGFTDKAAVGSTKVIRKLNGQEQTIHVSLDGVIMPEDIIVVPRSFF